VGRVTVADTAQDSGLAIGSVTVSVAGVSAVSPPEPVFDWPEALVYTRFRAWTQRTAIYTRLGNSE